MKPDPRTAMGRLIADIRAAMPFDTPQAELCAGPCTGCPKKLLEFLETELSEWEQALEKGWEPRLGDLHRLGRRAQKIHRVLVRNHLVRPSADT